MSDAAAPQAGPAASADGDLSAAFDRLHETVRRWIWRQGWTELRDIQEQSIPILLGGEQDLIIAAGTASGKTEAAFLPIVSRLAWDAKPPGGGFEVIYVSPLRALINDQFGRIEALCDELGVAVTKWHGDVAASVKQRARRQPQGILLTTPESLEAILVRRGNEAGRLFAALGYVVVDEMHAFMDAPRGRQLQSLLNRVELAAGHRVARIGLSATLADMAVSRAFLRPLEPASVATLDSRAGGQELRLQLRGYVQPARTQRRSAREQAEEAGEPEDPAENAIVRHLFDSLRGKRSLIFAGARGRVELVTAGLNNLTEALGVPEEFFAHHGSLSREHREDVERRMKDANRPASIIATTTLELGIDVGHIEAVAQLGPGHTVSGMRQRVGRSGRRASHAAVMRVYVKEFALDERSHPVHALRCETVQAVAMLNLMLRRWNEPPTPGRLHLSTLVHQLLALIAQHGGLTAKQGWTRLVESGVFPGITPTLYTAVLRRMGHPEVKLLDQAPDGTLLPGAQGERVIGGRDFYAVFMTPEEFKVVTDRGRTLGMVPIGNYVPGQLLIFAGRRWRVLALDVSHKEIRVTAASGGAPPRFDGVPTVPADEVVAEMRRIYEGIPIPSFLDEMAVTLLTEARESFDHLGLRHSSARRHDGQILLFPWVGDRTQMALRLAMAAHKRAATSLGIAISVPGEHADTLADVLRTLANGPAPDPLALARLVPEMRRAKYDEYLGDDLLAICYASEHIDAARVPAVAANLLARLPPDGSKI